MSLRPGVFAGIRGAGEYVEVKRQKFAGACTNLKEPRISKTSRGTRAPVIWNESLRVSVAPLRVRGSGLLVRDNLCSIYDMSSTTTGMCLLYTYPSALVGLHVTR